MYEFDLKAFDFCRSNGLRYTRYADDTTISGKNITSSFPIISYISSLLLQYGYLLNNQKTKVMNQSQRQIITGITVNKKLNVPLEYRKKIRQEI